ncbi:MAG TPA: NADH-quinone oxidoreductase subunit C [Acidimicrobiia bacterium]|nr:NADH-quinone oxidoreductase subunit C [Acidimicrobiia bacterium]
MSDQQSDDAPQDPAEDAPEAPDAPEETAAAPEPAEPAPAVLPEHEGWLAALAADLGDDIVEAVSNHGDLVVRVKREAWHRAAEVARTRLGCEYLSFISAIDWLPRPDPPNWDPDAPSAPVQPKEMTFGAAGGEGRFQVFACVESTDDVTQVILKTDVNEQNPSVASWTDVFPGADWHERECWEMYGIEFEGHPHLRHLYLPAEFEGNPGRKDFPLLSRETKPWPGLVDVELMPGSDEEPAEEASA